MNTTPKNEQAADSGSAAPTCSVSSIPSATPETDAIFRLISLANHPETDGEHFRAFLESARNGVESLERERDMLAERERKCPTALEADCRALLRALQEICDAVGMTEAASPAQIVNRVRQISQNH